MKNMRFKVGDRVQIKSIDWYNENKDEDGEVACGEFYFLENMKKFCSEILTIQEDVDEGYLMLEDNLRYVWTDEMIEGLAEESDDFEKMYMESEKRYEEEYSKGEYCHEQSFKWGFQEGYDYAHENEKLEINLKNGYEFKDDNGNVINTQKIIMEKKKVEVSAFRYRTNIGLEIEEIFRTTYFDGMDFWREGDLTLDDAERHVVSIIENDKEFKTIIANQLHKLANAIETGEENLRGYICDYDSYPVYSLNGVIKIDWHKLNEEKKLKNNDKNTEK